MAKNKRDKAQRRLREQRAAEKLAKLGEDVDPVTDPVSALQAVAARMRVLQDFLWDELQPKTDDAHRPDPFAVQVYQDAAERLAKQLAELRRLGIAELHVKIEHEKAQLIATCLQAILRDLNLTPEQRAIAPQVVREHLLALPLDGDPGELPVASVVLAQQRHDADLRAARDAAPRRTG